MGIHKKAAGTILLSLISGTFISAQVTIGMGAAPARAGLLQIKDQTADANNVTCTKGGLILPRVSLVNLQTLEPFISPSDVKYESEKSENVGLLVYNISKVNQFTPGLYLWDGERWGILRLSADTKTPGDDDGTTVPTDPNVPIDINDPAGLKLSNAFIVGNNKSVDIPVIKAYSVWKQLLNVDVNLSGKVTAELLWQDTPDLIKSVSLPDGDKSFSSKIRVTTNNSSIKGNALVALKVDGVVRWSWHIWVTDYDPEVSGGQKVFNNVTFMNRNLGALNITPGNIGSLGLLYQWGRKDPLAGSSAVDSNTEKELYTLSGEITYTKKAAVSAEYNLSNAIINPVTFYFSTVGNQDWYSNSSSLKNDHLWNTTDGSKGVYDPCPRGWRVPSSGAGSSCPWNGLGGSSAAFDKGKGEDWPQAGYYPAAGYRNSANGDLSNVGTEGYVWAASTFYSTAYRLWFKSYYTQIDEKDCRAKANSVRCVKE